MNQKIQNRLTSRIFSGNFQRGSLGTEGTGVGVITASNLLGIEEQHTIAAYPRINYIEKFSDALASYLIGTFFQKEYRYEISLSGENQDVFELKTDAISDLSSIDKLVGQIAGHEKISELISTLYTLGFKDFVVSTWDKESIYTYEIVEI